MKRSRFSEEQIIGILKEHQAGLRPVREPLGPLALQQRDDLVIGVPGAALRPVRARLGRSVRLRRRSIRPAWGKGFSVRERGAGPEMPERLRPVSPPPRFACGLTGPS